MNALSDSFSKGPLMTGGIVLSVLGVIAIVLPQEATLTIETLVGIVLILAGVGGFSAMRGNSGSLSLGSAGFLFGLMLLAGILMLVYPIGGAQTLTLITATMPRANPA